jgi:hypothetical protein
MANGYTLAVRLARIWPVDIFTQDIANGYYLRRHLLARTWLMAVPHQADFIKYMANGFTLASIFWPENG